MWWSIFVGGRISISCSTSHNLGLRCFVDSMLIHKLFWELTVFRLMHTFRFDSYYVADHAQSKFVRYVMYVFVLCFDRYCRLFPFIPGVWWFDYDSWSMFTHDRSDRSGHTWDLRTSSPMLSSRRYHRAPNNFPRQTTEVMLSRIHRMNGSKSVRTLQRFGRFFDVEKK